MKKQFNMFDTIEPSLAKGTEVLIFKVRYFSWPDSILEVSTDEEDKNYIYGVIVSSELELTNPKNPGKRSYYYNKYTVLGADGNTYIGFHNRKDFDSKYFFRTIPCHISELEKKIAKNKQEISDNKSIIENCIKSNLENENKNTECINIINLLKNNEQESTQSITRKLTK